MNVYRMFPFQFQTPVLVYVQTNRYKIDYKKLSNIF